MDWLKSFGKLMKGKGYGAGKTLKKKNMSEILEETVSFDSHGTGCAGRVYVNSSQQSSLPCIVMANGFSGTMDWLLPEYAQRFAAAGYLVLTEGTPRQLIDMTLNPNL
jgi:hypothetical protein